MSTHRLTAAQALVRYLQVQYSSHDEKRERLIGGMFGIFGHGNVAGMGQALDEYGDALPFYQAKNEQSMVHSAIGYAKGRNRRATLACTASIGPGSTNMITGAATATVNRIPVLLLPSDTFAHRRPGNVLQQLEHVSEGDTSVNDCFRPVSQFFDRVARPEQLLTALPEAMRVLTDPAETGAVTLSLHQDVQGERFEWPSQFFEERTWAIRRPAPGHDDLAQAVDAIAWARRPIVIAGGGIRYAEAQEALVKFCDRFGIPVAETSAGKGVASGSTLLLGGMGLNGTGAARTLTEGADLVLCIGTRLTDFTTASRSIFANPDVRFIGINVNSRDAHKLGSTALVADAKLALEALSAALASRGYATAEAYRAEVHDAVRRWIDAYDADILHQQGAAMKQGTILRGVNDAARSGDVMIAAAGTPPGEALKGWSNQAGSECFLEFGYSCMGHEIPAALGVRLARPDAGEIYVVIGDGTYLMCPTELVTAAQENLHITVVLIDNAGFQCIRGLGESTTGTENFGNEFRRRETGQRQPNGQYLNVDYLANARSMGAAVLSADTPEGLKEALDEARRLDGPVVIVAKADRRATSVGADAWWDLGVAQVTGLDRTRRAVDAVRAASSGQRVLV